MPNLSRLCPVSTIPQTDIRTNMHTTGQKSSPSGSAKSCAVSQVWAWMRAGGRERAREHTDRATTPASCSTTLELSRGLSISAWHKQPSLSGHLELTASQKLPTLERIHFSPGLPSEKQLFVDNRVKNTLGTTFREFTGARKKKKTNPAP